MRAAYWIFPSLLCLLLYWNGLRAWFQMDDFAWLALRSEVQDWPSLWRGLFEPRAQGTIRPLSERLFFIVLFELFGLHSLPYRAVVFATQFANLVLLSSLVLRITGSRLAGFMAPVLWIANTSLALPLTWTSAYNQILCAFFLLLALRLFVEYCHTGRLIFYWAQWTAFLLGFGALEINIVYPALALLYAVCFHRAFVRATVPLLAVSAGYFVLHRVLTPAARPELYTMYFDWNLPGTLLTYVQWSLGASRIASGRSLASAHLLAAEILLGVSILLFALWELRARRPPALFGAGWFVIAIAPVLPLRNHVSDYYNVIPSLGFAILGAWAAALAWRNGSVAPRLAASVLVLAYLIPSVWGTHIEARYSYVSSRETREFLARAAYAHRRHPNEILLFRGVTTRLFWSAVYADPFRLLGTGRVYLAAEDDSLIHRVYGMPPIDHWFLPERVAQKGLVANRLVVYEVLGERLRNITTLYESSLVIRGPTLPYPRRVEAGNPLYEAQLVQGWYPAEEGFRWMGQRAQVEMAAAGIRGGTLEVRGTCPEQHLRAGPLQFTLRIDGKQEQTRKLDRAQQVFSLAFPLAATPNEGGKMLVELEVERPLRIAGDERSLGVVIDSLQLTPAP